MQNIDFLKKLKEEKLVVVVRGKSLEEAIETAEACIQGGVKFIEITFTVPGASKIINILSRKYNGQDIYIGAGTVLEIEVAKEALENGAEYIVSPDFNPYLSEYCKKGNIAYTPGVFSPSEVASAMRGGCQVLKLFPGDIAKPQGLKALRGPFPNASFMVTGGVSYENMKEWFDAGATAIGAGSNLTIKAKNGDFNGVREDAKMWVNRIKEIFMS
ncbi:MAG: KHG/KDPG aldolase [Firmicutes bacterium ADurb.Bin080]|jgi:2-dehydro-3-deoxyphosphogluconate aldolase/(4S)-4-hydroxy-2-oxoglutarate aldolase|nr:bifunctional 2-keto-4-hydroxyglutarate aldolase/2-keto-3-deoxy-6-phosphogluconate aldolase [Clostridiales bacterium]OQC16328.1 MAG: KHG/KDPG aldolase [Firmicutes bacterium ADurb.Bin080]